MGCAVERSVPVMMMVRGVCLKVPSLVVCVAIDPMPLVEVNKISVFKFPWTPSQKIGDVSVMSVVRTGQWLATAR